MVAVAINPIFFLSSASRIALSLLLKGFWFEEQLKTPASEFAILFDLSGGPFEGKDRCSSKICPSQCVAKRPMHFFGTGFLGGRGTQTECAKVSGGFV